MKMRRKKSESAGLEELKERLLHKHRNSAWKHYGETMNDFSGATLEIHFLSFGEALREWAGSISAESFPGYVTIFPWTNDASRVIAFCGEQAVQPDIATEAEQRDFAKKCFHSIEITTDMARFCYNDGWEDGGPQHLIRESDKDIVRKFLSDAPIEVTKWRIFNSNYRRDVEITGINVESLKAELSK
jgi:hypothetical protein